VMADTWDTHSREDMMERAMLPVWSRTARHVSRTRGTPTRCNTYCGLVIWDSKPPNATDGGFAKFGPQNLATTVPLVICGGTWHHSEGCVKAKQLCVERVAIKSKT
jgi:hypothetical protein